MAITTLDTNTALIIIDLQKGIIALPTAHPAQPVIEKSATLAKAFRRHQRPVVVVNVVGHAPGRNDSGPASNAPLPSDWAELTPELDIQDSDIMISKTTWGAFNKTDLDQQLQKLGVTQVVIVGIATSIGVESTARQAFELGYNVTIATDSVTDLNIDTHNNSCDRVFPRLAETGSTADVLALLEK